MYKVYARAGWGSVLVEAALKLGGLSYELIDVDIRGVPDDRRKLAAINPMVQLPTIVTPDGTVMTESGAILLYIAERGRGAWRHHPTIRCALRICAGRSIPSPTSMRAT